MEQVESNTWLLFRNWYGGTITGIGEVLKAHILILKYGR